MTPKFKYDPQQHCLREVARPKKTRRPEEDDSSVFDLYNKAYDRYLQHLRVIPCVENSVWSQVELIEGVHFEVRMRMWENRTRYAWPIQSKPPRTFTLAEVLEIWDAAERIGVQCYTECKSSQPSEEQYFKNRFNVDI